jgi:hypothetical protein
LCGRSESRSGRGLICTIDVTTSLDKCKSELRRRNQVGSILDLYINSITISSAIDHRTGKTELPVRSAVLKPGADQLVLRLVTTWES